jgi:hypothetical protein
VGSRSRRSTAFCRASTSGSIGRPALNKSEVPWVLISVSGQLVESIAVVVSGVARSTVATESAGRGFRSAVSRPVEVNSSEPLAVRRQCMSK